MLAIRQRREFPAFLQGKALQAAILLVVAFAFGGGGSGAGLANLVVQLVALALIAFNLRAFMTFFTQGPRFVACLVAATLLLPLAQSIPLPPSIWQVLPGRAIVTESFHLFGKDDAWFPMSLEVRRTLLAFLSLIPPLTILVLAWQLPETQKRQLLTLVAATGAVVVLLGTRQLVTGNRELVLFAEAYGTDDLHGTFANRNTAGLFMDIALCALIAVFPKERAGFKWVSASVAVAILLLVGLALTRSRSSMVLVTVPLAFLLLRVLRSRMISMMRGRTIVLTLMGVALLAGGLVFVAGDNQRLQRSFGRFENLEDRRPLIWADTMGSIKRFWPLGSGTGTFDEVFQVDETLENLRYARAARAHNDYLEASLESGLIGIVLILAWAGALSMGVRRAIRTDSLACASTAVFALLAFQSLSDYPLRSQTLLCVAGLMLALSIQAPARKSRLEVERESGDVRAG